MIIKKAERKQAKMKLALQGPSGSGKTYSALLMAFGLCGSWNKIVIIDTENGSSNLYAHLGDFNVIQIAAPYNPEKFISAINLAESSNMSVIIVDSISHEWEGKGGIIDIHGNMTGNSFTNWSKVTPRHNAFVQSILNCNSHIIGAIRTKQDYVLTEKNGKLIPEKVGLKGVTRDGMDYEFTVVLDLDIKHNATASKDRTSLFVDKPQFIITDSTGRTIKEWCEKGNDVKDVIQQVQRSKSINTLREIYNKFPEHQKELGNLFTEQKRIIEADKLTNDLTLNTKENGISESQNNHERINTENSIR
jgi:hypothetical protein